MKKLFSTKYSAGAVNAAMLILRLGFGVIMVINHGYQKITHFSNTAEHMPHLFGMSGNVSASLIIFAEFFCGILVALGLFTRLACIPVIIGMGVALYLKHGSSFVGQGEAASLFLIGFLAILFIGPGKISVDGAIGK